MKYRQGRAAGLLRMMAAVAMGLLTLGGVLLSPLSSESRAEDGNQNLEEIEESEEIEDLADIEPTIPDSWQDLEHAELGFTVNLPPGSLRESIQPLETSLGTLELYMIGLENNEQVYGVIVADFPEFFEVIPRETRFDGAVAGVLTNVRRRLVQDRQVALSGNPGRILLYEGEDGFVYQHHIYWVGTRLYQTIAAVPARLPQRQRAEFFEAARPFFHSFSLTD
ncbi:hypothetical protein [Sodalinema gerasimenkoae]|uniref:hypothetical protein n=1 Tax=Sodalinema gerasimenkoae TaxID=2862348 RepID=UPI00135BF6DC|nr:hypothetical protein [Sodalinema gerasimenkoae]